MSRPAAVFPSGPSTPRLAARQNFRSACTPTTRNLALGIQRFVCLPFSWLTLAPKTSGFAIRIGRECLKSAENVGCNSKHSTVQQLNQTGAQNGASQAIHSVLFSCKPKIRCVIQRAETESCIPWTSVNLHWEAWAAIHRSRTALGRCGMQSAAAPHRGNIIALRPPFLGFFLHIPILGLFSSLNCGS